MKEITGEITHYERIHDYHRNTIYKVASAKFYVDGKEYYGNIGVGSHKVPGQKIKILYNPKNPNEFDSKESSYSVVFISIIIGIVFLIPKVQSKRRTKNS